MARFGFARTHFCGGQKGESPYWQKGASPKVKLRKGRKPRIWSLRTSNADD
jgi:hypothetical protein